MTEMIFLTRRYFPLVIYSNVNKIGCIKLENIIMIKALGVKARNMGSKKNVRNKFY